MHIALRSYIYHYYIFLKICQTCRPKNCSQHAKKLFWVGPHAGQIKPSPCLRQFYENDNWQYSFQTLCKTDCHHWKDLYLHLCSYFWAFMHRCTFHASGKHVHNSHTPTSTDVTTTIPLRNGKIIPVFPYTHQGINISHLGNRKIIFKMPFLGDPYNPPPLFHDLLFQNQRKNRPKSRVLIIWIQASGDDVDQCTKETIQTRTNFLCLGIFV